MAKPPNKLTTDYLGRLIYEIRGQRVMLDSDLAAIYGVSTKRLNEQFRRNRKRFPDDFAFQLTAEEASSIRSQIATASAPILEVANCDLKIAWRPTLSPMGFYRAWSVASSQYPQ